MGLSPHVIYFADLFFFFFFGFWDEYIKEENNELSPFLPFLEHCIFVSLSSAEKDQEKKKKKKEGRKENSGILWYG